MTGKVVAAEAMPLDDWSLSDARSWLRERLDDGASCPCCKQFAKVYRRGVSSSHALALIAIWRHARQETIHFPTFRVEHSLRLNHLAILSEWGLIAEDLSRRPDGGNAGRWSITSKGAAWINGRETIPKYALIYDSRCLGFDGPEVRIGDVLGDRFDLRTLMGSAPETPMFVGF